MNDFGWISSQVAPPLTEDRLKKALQLINNAEKTVVFTGAGVSQDSGIPTFRDKTEGLWANFRAEILATPQAFRRDPSTVLGWYEWRRYVVSTCLPNAAHHFVAKLAQRKHVSLITQNVDDLHERASTGHEKVIHHLHGDLLHLKCFDCGHKLVNDLPIVEKQQSGLEVPKCPSCNVGLMRPNVVWFGENLNHQQMLDSEQLIADSSLVIVIGTSGLVYPAAGLIDLAAQLGKKLIVIDPEVPHYTPTVHLAEKAAHVCLRLESIECPTE